MGADPKLTEPQRKLLDDICSRHVPMFVADSYRPLRRLLALGLVWRVGGGERYLPTVEGLEVNRGR